MCSNNASAESVRPGAITLPMYVPSTPTTSNEVAVLKSTTIAGPP